MSMEPSGPFGKETGAEEHLVKAVNFQRMGLVASAERELQLARQSDPAIVADARYRAFNDQKVEERNLNEAWKLPMRVGAVIAILDGLVTVVLCFFALMNLQASSSTKDAASGIIWEVLHFGVDIFLVITLLQLKDVGRRVAIFAF